MERRVKLSRFSRAGSAVAIGALALTLAACGSDDPVGSADGATDGSSEGSSETASDLSGELNGAGASSQESAMEAWRAGFQSANPDVTVNYDPVGSGGGRTQFLEGGVAFAGSDAVLKEEEITQSQAVCGPDGAIDLPVYVSPIAIIYNLPDVAELNLAPATIAGIFNGTITQWNAPEIAADNPDATLPDLAITPVHRSDESGTTENFTEYLAATAGDAWGHEPSGDWPTQGGESAQGTSGVVQTVQGGEGTIGYADASQAGDLGVASLKVGDEYVGPSPEAAAKILEASAPIEGRGDSHIVMDIDHKTTEAGVYPAVLVSYQIACLQYDDEAKADLVKGWLTYVASSDGQQAAAEGAGSAPLTSALEERISGIAEGISAK